MSDYKKVLEFLKENKVDPEKALVSLKRDFSINLPDATDLKYHWKMARFTLYIWERVKEHKNGYLKPKIDTAISVIRSRKFENYHYGYFPDIKIDEKKEVRLLNKLIAEKAQRSLFTSGEGYYYYENSSKIIQQDYLDIILSFKKEV